MAGGSKQHLQGNRRGHSDSPTGPFKDAKRAALVTYDMLPVTENDKANLDPTVLIDTEGETCVDRL